MDSDGNKGASIHPKTEGCRKPLQFGVNHSYFVMSRFGESCIPGFAASRVGATQRGSTCRYAMGPVASNLFRGFLSLQPAADSRSEERPGWQAKCKPATSDLIQISCSTPMSAGFTRFTVRRRWR